MSSLNNLRQVIGFLMALAIGCFFSLKVRGQTYNSDSLEWSVKRIISAENKIWKYQETQGIKDATEQTESDTKTNRCLLFFPDQTFEEWIFKELNYPPISEKCTKKLANSVYTVLLSGDWIVLGNTILLKYRFGLAYEEKDFLSCLSVNPPYKFKCKLSPLCNFNYSLNSMYLFENNFLKKGEDNTIYYR